LVIATKFSGNLYPGDPNGGGSGRKSLINAIGLVLRVRPKVETLGLGAMM
jgi:hypothetical protein